MVEKAKAVVKSFPVRRGNFMFRVHMNEEKGTTVAIFEGMQVRNDNDVHAGKIAGIFNRLGKEFVGKTQLHKEDTFDAKIGVRWAIKKCFNAMRSEILNYMQKCNNRVLNAMDELDYLIHFDGTSPKQGSPEHAEWIKKFFTKAGCDYSSCTCGGGK